MQYRTSVVGTFFTASRRFALLAGVCAATLGLSACGSDTSKTTTPTKGSTTGTTGTATGTTTGATTGSTTGTTTTTAGTQDCTPSGNSSFVGQSQGVALSPNSGTSTPMPYVLFIHNPNATDPNKKYAVSVFDYDYCAFSADHGYTTWPINGFHAASFFLTDAANSNGTFATGKYTVAAGSQSIYFSSAAGDYGSGVTKTSAGGGGSSCVGQTYPVPNGGSVTISSTPNAGNNAISGVTGSFDSITLNDGSTLSGSFTSGTCSTSTTATPPSPDMCACTLGK